MGSVHEMSEEPPVADGKRRKVNEVEEDAPPPFAADRDAPPSPGKEVAPSSTSKSSALSAPKSSVVSTPARPSPLWQVSQAGAPVVQLSV